MSAKPLLALALLAAILAMPADAAPDPQVLSDGAECFSRLSDGTSGTCGVLYAHISGFFPFAPLSVQPLPEEAPDLAEGFSGTPGVDPFWPFHRKDLVLATSGVYWADGPLCCPTRGGTDPVRLLPDVPIFGYWYLSADSLEVSPLGIGAGSESLGGMPCVAVEMVLYDTWSIMKLGVPVAQGKTTRSVLSLAGQDDAPLPFDDPCPDSAGPLVLGRAHEFAVQLDPLPDAPRTLPGLAVQVVWYQFDPSGDPAKQDKAIQREWNLRTGPEFRPRFVVPVENPTRVEETFLGQAEGWVGASARVTGAWGRYEFIEESITRHGHSHNPSIVPSGLRFLVVDPDGAAVETSTVRGPIVRYAGDHGGAVLNITYLWRPGDEPGLAPGKYTLVIEADNLQRTATARAEFEYTFAPVTMREGSAPSVALLMVFALVSALVVTWRRRAP